jgi:histidinol-phosphate aminotransferase
MIPGFPAPRPHLAQVRQVAHGSLDFNELDQLGLRPDQVIDFSSNTNAYGLPPGVRTALLEAIEGNRLESYPDREALGLRRALAERIGIDIDQILTGNGSAELIQLVAQAYIEPGQPALVLGPTFGEYARGVKVSNGQVDYLIAEETDHFIPDQSRITRQLDRFAYRLVFICTPNNPTGQAIPVDQLAGWADGHPQTLFIIDEAYLAFASGLQSAMVLRRPNLLVLRSLTKEYALAGLRLGYVTGHPGVIAAVRRVQPSWSTNSLAQAAGVAALKEAAYLQDSLPHLRAEAQRMRAVLTVMGYSSAGGVVHFFLLRCTPRFTSGAALRAALRQHGLLVRDCASFGLPDYVRIAARRAIENDRLLAAIQEIRV